MAESQVDMPSTFTPELQTKINQWLSWDKNPGTSGVIRKLVAEKDHEELGRILLKRLVFGTAGLRGRMWAGYSSMNDLVIVQTGQGMLKYLREYRESLLVQNGIVIGFDGRHNSQRWAQITAAIFVHAGYKVRLSSDVHPTPFVPFTVKVYNLAAGIMITASHNPKEDNGYKVYHYNSAQIISPEDERIQQAILQSLEPLPTSWDTSVLNNNPLVIDHLPDVTQMYIAKIIKECISCWDIHKNEEVGLEFVYTAMHGVGWATVERVAAAVKGKVHPVPEQKDPHPDFPTVKFPNPEEGKSSLDLSFKFADAKGINIILANDPDADRFAVAEKNKNTGEWKVFSGNELGTLFGWWMFRCQKKNEPYVPVGEIYMIASTVSSKILKTMAQAEGFNFEDTLTGFKWIGNKALDLEAEGFKVAFAFEEAIGFMCNDKIVDKDGVSALAQFVCLANYLHAKGKQVTEQLEELYDRYGLHLTYNSYYFCYEPDVIKRVFDRIRNLNGPGQYPTGILYNKYTIVAVRDLTIGYDSSQPNNRPILPVSPENQMITFIFNNGLHITLRTSGTEPKIKFYSELCLQPGIKDKTMGLNMLHEMVNAICEDFLQPDQNGLIPKSKN